MQVTLIALRNVQFGHIVYIPDTSAQWYLNNGHTPVSLPVEVTFPELSQQEIRENTLSTIGSVKKEIQKNTEKAIKQLEAQEAELMKTADQSTISNTEN